MPEQATRVELGFERIAIGLCYGAGRRFLADPINMNLLKRSKRLHRRFEAGNGLANVSGLGCADGISCSETGSFDRLDHAATRLHLISDEASAKRVGHRSWPEAGLRPGDRLCEQAQRVETIAGTRINAFVV